MIRIVAQPVMALQKLCGPGRARVLAETSSAALGDGSSAARLHGRPRVVAREHLCDVIAQQRNPECNNGEEKNDEGGFDGDDHGKAPVAQGRIQLP